ncbi:PP2C family protein-serine/threonine phosphatase [Marinospirillum perlucidum]|uniref:PP2C family protein-serine/threonine phosphatase n=1 Tax=Marinospirillum perlucidum TaxID=1982602 RepID=UPI000DF3D8BF|nr:PP2C family protein-serine/threonine phosphatase [Marinospirillum perlucidum]
MNKCQQEAAVSYQQELEQENADLKTSLALLRQDQEAGYHVQQTLLPDNPTQVNSFRLDYWLRPSLYLSGDFVDCWPLPDNKMLFYLADVSGHGASSAFVTILIKYLLGKYSETVQVSPADLCKQLNEELLAGGLDKHLTLVLGVLDTQTREMTYALGAHLPTPLLCLGSGEVRELEGTGMPIGLFPDALYKDYTCIFPEQGRLCVASDGILELMPGQGLEERQQAWRDLVQKTGGEIEALLQHLPASQEQWPDDVTLMTLTGC